MPKKKLPILQASTVRITHAADGKIHVMYDDVHRISISEKDLSYFFEFYYNYHITSISFPKTILPLDTNALGNAALSYSLCIATIKAPLPHTDKSAHSHNQVPTKASASIMEVISFAKTILDKSFDDINTIKELIPTLNTLKQVVQSIPNHHSVITPLMSIENLIGNAYTILGDKGEAMKCYSASIKHISTIAQKNLPKEFHKPFIETCKSIISLKEKVPTETEERIVKTARSWPKATDAIETSTMNDAYKQVISIELLQNNPAKAEEYFGKMSKTITPAETMEIRTQIANTYYENQEYKKAIEIFHKIASTQLKIAEPTYSNMAKAYFDNGLFGIAASLGTKSIEQNECTNENRALEKMHHMLAVAYSYIGYHDKSSMHLNAAMSFQLSNDDAVRDILVESNQNFNEDTLISKLTDLLKQRNDPELITKLTLLEIYYYDTAIINEDIEILAKKYYQISISIRKAIDNNFAHISKQIDTIKDCIDIRVPSKDDASKFMQDNRPLYIKAFSKPAKPDIEAFKAAALTLEEQITVIKMLSIKVHQHSEARGHKPGQDGFYGTIERFEKLKKDATEHIMKPLEQCTKNSIQLKSYQQLYLKGYLLSLEAKHKEAGESYQKALDFGDIVPLYHQAAIIVNLLETKLRSDGLSPQKKIALINTAFSDLRKKIPVDNYFTGLLTLSKTNIYLENKNPANARSEILKALEIFHNISPDLTPILSLTCQQLLATTYHNIPGEHETRLKLSLAVHKLYAETGIYPESTKLDNLENIYHVLEQICLANTPQSNRALNVAEQMLLEIIEIRKTTTDPDLSNIIGLDYHNLTMLYMSKGLYDKALETQSLSYDAFLKDPDKYARQLVDMTRIKAEIYRYKKDYAQCITLSKKWMEEAQKFDLEQKLSKDAAYKFYHSLWLSYHALNEVESTLIYAEKALIVASSDDDHDDEQQYECNRIIGICCHQLKKYDMAIKHLNEAHRYAPTTNEALITKHIGDSLYCMAHNLTGDEALAQYRFALEKYNIASRSLSTETDFEISVYKIAIHLQLNNTNDALTLLFDISETKSDNIKCHVIGSVIKQYLHNRKGSLDVAESHQIVLNSGIVMLAKNIESPSIENDTKAKFYASSGAFYLATKKLNAAVLHLRKAADLTPENQEVKALLAGALQQTDPSYAPPAEELPQDAVPAIGLADEAKESDVP